MNYRSIASLNRDVVGWLERLPRFDVVVGVPRSGLLVATLVSLYRNIPLTDVDGLIKSRLIAGGVRLGCINCESYLLKRRRVLVVDDSVTSGRQMALVKERISSAELCHTIAYGAMYIASKIRNASGLDCYGIRLRHPRCFEWNIMHHPCLKNACMDIDGVLCRDPTRAENDDGSRYRHFLQTVEPKYTPTKEVGFLVTCRLEKYRGLTEEWLAKHGIRYQYLRMMDYPDKKSRMRSGSHAAFKAAVYSSTSTGLFIESCPVQAGEIARLTKRSVLCTQTMEMAPMDFVSSMHQKTRCNSIRYIRHPGRTLRKSVSLIKNYVKAARRPRA